MSKSTFRMKKKTRGNTIDEDTVRDRRETTHNLGDEGMGKVDMCKIKTKIRPTGMIKGFG